MFIVSKKKFIVRRADGSSYLIRKDYIGEIPGDVAESNLVQKAIRGCLLYTSVPPRMQRIIRYKVFDGLTWGQVAARMGRKATADSVKKEFQRFMAEK